MTPKEKLGDHIFDETSFDWDMNVCEFHGLSCSVIAVIYFRLMDQHFPP